MKLKIALSGLLVAVTAITFARASSDTDILLNLLVKKGVLTEQEASDTRKELETTKQEDTKKATETKSKKSWVGSIAPGVNLDGLIQLKYSHQEFGTNTFENRRIRLDFNGQPDDHWEWKVLGELGGSYSNVLSGASLSNSSTLSTSTTKVQKAVLLDAYVRYKFNQYANVQAGQFKVPFSYENLRSDYDLDFIDRSQVVDKFVPDRDNGSIGRDIGVQFDGSYSTDSNRKWVEYAVAVVNGNGYNFTDDNQDKDFVGRAVVYPIKDLGIGISGYKGRSGKTPTTKDRIGTELVYVHDPYSFKGEYITGTDNTTDKEGWYVSGGYKFLKKFQAVARYDTYDPNTKKAGDRTDVTTFGVNWFINNNNKLQFNYEYQTAQTGNPADVLAIQYSLKF